MIIINVHIWCNSHSTSISAYKEGKDQNSSLQKKVLHTYKFKLDQSRISIIYIYIDNRLLIEVKVPAQKKKKKSKS